jgi:hypothetical protein
MSTFLPGRNLPIWIAALTCLGGLTCFRSVDPTKIKCVDKSSCPSGFSCVQDNARGGHCEPDAPPTDGRAADLLPGAGGGTAGTTGIDGPRGGGATGSSQGGTSGWLDGAQAGLGGAAGSGTSRDASGAGGAAPDAVPGTGGISNDAPNGSGGTTSPNGSGGTTSPPDAPISADAPGSAIGSSCTSDGECSSTHCIDGVCCATTCTGCSACSNALTGDLDGKCAPVASGKIAHQACTDETATKPCGNDGTCDGKGACRKAAAGKQCGDAACQADTNTYLPAPTCDGNGTCSAGTPQACSPYQCTATGCNKACSKQTDCESGTYCDTTLGTCAPTKPNGTAATQPYECTHGIVADGVCCDKACTGCNACTATLNGQAASTTGTCLPVTTAKGAAPHGACTIGSDPCGMDGTCDGNGSCHYPAVGSDCGTPSCNLTTSMITKSTCSSSHTCTAGAATACAGSMACLATGTGCKTGACTSNSDCASGNYCLSGGTCGRKQQGDTCGAPAECSNGLYCVDGVCCNAACTELCKACNLASSKGTCTRLTSGQPVHGNACSTDGSACGGSCNGSSDTACYYPPAGQSCGAAASCSSDLTTLNASACTGDGSCGPANQSCSTAGKYCDSTTTSCATKKTSGSCTLPIQCSTGSCCSGNCVSLGTDTNCSACGDACFSPKTCQGGACSCSTGYTTCGSTCCSNSTQYCTGVTCNSKKTNGNSCAGGDGSWCTSGNCVDNTCCASTSCGPDQNCGGGTCVCNNGYFYGCGNSDCASWNFESGSLVGISTNGVLSGLAISTSQYHGGTHSLKAHIKSTQNGDGGAIVVSLCRNNPGHSTYASSISFYMLTVDTNGTFPTLGNYMAWVDDCGGSPVGGAGMGSTGGAWSYKSYSGFISTFDLCTIRFQFGFGAAYEGDVYIDDIQLTSP